jgi:catechol 2,3-dioxygenase
MTAEKENAMPSTPKPRLTHMALFTYDLETMADFYTRVMGLAVSDRGAASSAPVQMVFLSSDPQEHHQFVLANGRPDYATFSIAQQISFLVNSLDELRTMHNRVADEGMEIIRTVTHGNAWSVYFEDPERNRIEIYAHTPWHVPQPHSHPFDIALPNEEIMKQTEAHCRADPGFMTVAEREKILAKRIELVD